MKKRSYGQFSSRLVNKRDHYPWSGQIELTYRCSLNCEHCYCKGSEDEDRELNTDDWKKILDEIHSEGCLWLCLTGGEPLVREDFLELYFYAKKKGFIITLFTNGQAFTDEIIDYLEKSPPFSIEITLNGITQNTYEAITQVEDSFERVIATIGQLKKRNIHLTLKSNCLRHNSEEIGKIKAFTEEILGRPAENKHRFKYDPMIYPRLNGDRSPTNHRLSFEKLLEVKKQDPDIWEEYQKGLHTNFPDLKRDNLFLYQCNAWLEQFFINPYGSLKFCIFSNKFSVDLKTTSFKEGFYNVFPQLLNERFKTNSKCRNCDLRPVCYQCPARAFLETGDEEATVPYFCELAKETAKKMKQ